MEVRRQGNPVTYVLTIVILVILALFAAAEPAPGQDYLDGLDLPVDGKLYPKETPKVIPPSITDTPPKAPDPPIPETQEDLKPPTIYGSEVKSESSTVIFVLDDSGSMGLDWTPYPPPNGANRLDRAKAELDKAISSLPSNWQFNVFAYDCGYWSWSQAMMKADNSNKSAAIDWIRSQEPAGGTATHSGVCAALDIRENRLIILLTDGAPSCAGGIEEQRKAIFGANAQRATINVFGISCPSGSEMEKFCMNVAGDNNGVYVSVR